MILKPSASKQEKTQAVNRIADAAAAQVSKDVAANVKRQLRTSKTKEQLKKGTAAVLGFIKKPTVGPVAALGAGFALGEATIRRLAEDRVRKAEKAVAKQYPNGFPSSIREPLLQQHIAEIRKQGVIAPSKSLPTLR